VTGVENALVVGAQGVVRCFAGAARTSRHQSGWSRFNLSGRVGGFYRMSQLFVQCRGTATGTDSDWLGVPPSYENAGLRTEGDCGMTCKCLHLCNEHPDLHFPQNWPSRVVPRNRSLISHTCVCLGQFNLAFMG
jgi:hypothetical protein